MEWVEVQGKTVELAVNVALQELGIESRDDADIEVMQDPQRGFLGIGGRDAVVRVKPKQQPKRRKRRRRGRSKGEDGPKSGRQDEAGTGGRSDDRGGNAKRQGDQRRGRRGGGRSGQAQQRGQRGGKGSQERQSQERQQPKKERAAMSDTKNTTDGKPEVDVNEQAQVVQEFLEGLLGAFGLEGAVATKVDDGIIYADVTGEQTEALVGTKGAILQAVLELTRTVVQRKTHAGARLRLDIAGYAERRREALQIYAKRLAEQVLSEGGELMLEPMNPADRKVVHDAVADVDGVRTFSEGEEPRRSVIISLAPGVEPTGDDGDGEGDDDGDDDEG